MECLGPGWISELYAWVSNKDLILYELENALNWLYQKGIITCYEIV